MKNLDLGVTTQGKSWTVTRMANRKQARDRVRARIRARLDELGMTARELARAVRPDAVSDSDRDSWISGVLNGSQGLTWKHFDAVADKLGMSPSELVRYDEAELRELAPHEMRLLRHYREWPKDIQERWLAMLDHFAATVPDKDTARLLDRLRSLPRSLRSPVMNWLFRLLEEGIPPEATTGGVELGPGDVSPEPDTTHPTRKVRKSNAFRRADDRRDESPPKP